MSPKKWYFENKRCNTSIAKAKCKGALSLDSGQYRLENEQLMRSSGEF